MVRRTLRPPRLAGYTQPRLGIVILAICAALSLLAACASPAPVENRSAAAPLASTLDASTLPADQWERPVEIQCFGGQTGQPSEVRLHPVKRHPTIFHGTRLASELTSRPVPKLRVPPAAPGELVSHRVSGTVLVAYIVKPDGRVENAQVIESTDRRFDEPVLDALERWLFVPGKFHDTPTSCLLVQEMVFKPEAF